jgi:hypothetical protein
VSSRETTRRRISSLPPLPSSHPPPPSLLFISFSMKMKKLNKLMKLPQWKEALSVKKMWIHILFVSGDLALPLLSRLTD